MILARRRFGQHFLHDRSVLDRIVEAVAPQPDHCSKSVRGAAR
jgi:16S rRNA A1518/A1519 N6-dimethyltransferase RsmA/KsgA/DIM1 with predicted DNA glycosylase/AP lyase activity